MTPERTARIQKVLDQRQAGLTVILENIEDPHNIAAIMRSCDAVGIQDIYVLSTLVLPIRAFGLKSSSSASKWLTVHHFSNVDELVKVVRSKYKTILTTHLDSQSTCLYDIDFTDSVALVFGNERLGVSAELRDLADGNFIVPQMGIIKSLNVSVACAVSIYEGLRQRKKAGLYDKPNLSTEQRAQIIENWGLTDAVS
jgi:tRNA (guanosine-2'-O-)-methyltransferase